MNLCDFCGEVEEDCTCATSKIRDERDHLCAAINRSTSELNDLRAKCERMEEALTQISDHSETDDITRSECIYQMSQIAREALAEQPENQ